MSPFDFSTITEITTKILDPVFMIMSDGASIATYPAIAKGAKAILIFFHGGGFFSGPLYQQFANDLADNHQIQAVLVDVRGHGRSSGPRGDAPSKFRVWDDISEIITNLETENPNTPLFLGGHSSGAGLILNYSDYKHDPRVAGYLMIAPYLGHSSDTARNITDPNRMFVKKVRLWAIIGHLISWGYFFGHVKSVFFNYPEEVLERNPLIIDAYTCAMSAAVTPSNAQQALRELDRPLAVFIGADDEQLDASKVIAFVRNCRMLTACEIISSIKHLDVLCNIAENIAEFFGH